MLVDGDKLEKQLQDAKSVEEPVRRAYLMLAHARLPGGMTVRPSGHGYIERELRFEKDGSWQYAAVLNQKWILWYFRKPALATGLVDEPGILAQFPDAQRTALGEFKIRLRTPEAASNVLRYIGVQGAG
ncbi:MAG: hypothetical protein ACK4LQ_02755 [Pararhodobacter sp.]